MVVEHVTWHGVVWAVEVTREGGPGISSEPRCGTVAAVETIDPLDWWAFSDDEPAAWLADAGPVELAVVEQLAVASYLSWEPDYGA